MGLRQRVMLLNKTPQPLLDHMRIDLRSRDVGVAKKLLHRAQIRATLKQMTGKSVAQHVRRHPRRLYAGGDGE
jgi:hypothetical protein